MIFDITTPDSAYEFIIRNLNISGEEFVMKYIIECKKNSNTFYETYKKRFNLPNPNTIKFKVIHVTTNWDNCTEIRENGIINLQEVLSRETNLSSKLLEYGIKFDIKKRLMCLNEGEIDIDYNRYKKMHSFNLSNRDKKICSIARKIYYDYPTSGFFASSNVSSYLGRVHERPEFLFTLSEFVPSVGGMIDEWINNSKSYIIHFIANYNNLDILSCFDIKEDDDIEGELKKWMIIRAVERAFQSTTDLCEVFAYMNVVTTIKPNQIIKYEEI